MAQVEHTVKSKLDIIKGAIMTLRSKSKSECEAEGIDHGKLENRLDQIDGLLKDDLSEKGSGNVFTGLLSR